MSRHIFDTTIFLAKTFTFWCKNKLMRDALPKLKAWIHYQNYRRYITKIEFSHWKNLRYFYYSSLNLYTRNFTLTFVENSSRYMDLIESIWEDLFQHIC